MVHSGKIRPDNYAEMLGNLIRRPYSGFGGNGFTGSFPPNFVNFPRLSQILPFSLANNVSNNASRNFIIGPGAGSSGFPPLNPQNPQVPPIPIGVPFFPSNPQGPPFYPPNPQFPPGVPPFYPPNPPTPPPTNYNPCPFRSQQLVYPGLPRLRGSFQGCCDRPLCYTPKQDLYLPYSGLSPYFTLWSSWGDCSVTCGGGRQNRTRSCVIPNNCSPSVRRIMRCDPRINRYEEKRCNTHICPFYRNWTPWSVCSTTCGGGVRTRSRVCNGVGQCNGPAQASEPCRTGRCPTFEYGQWSRCSNTCGEGVQIRTRRCTHPGAYGCPPTTIDRRPCFSYCGNWVRSCDPATCCSTQSCVQENGRPGYCQETPFFSTLCYQGNCFSRWPRPTCGGSSPPLPFSLNVGNAGK